MADVLVHLVDASNPMWRKQVGREGGTTGASCHVPACLPAYLCLHI